MGGIGFYNVWAGIAWLADEFAAGCYIAYEVW